MKIQLATGNLLFIFIKIIDFVLKICYYVRIIFRESFCMQLKESGEMYLETIFLLSKESAFVRSIDVCEYMGYSKPSVSRAVGLLKDGGYITVEKDGALKLTPLGEEIAQKTFERHTVLSAIFEKLGVNKETAAADACKIEHVISDETFFALKNHLEKNN